MKKGKLLYISFLSIVIVVTAVLSVSGLIKIIENEILYIPLAIFIVSLALLISVVLNAKNANEQRVLKNRLKMWNSITYKVKKAGETAFNELPIGIIVINNDSKIMWSNANARHVFMSPLENIYLKDLQLPLYPELAKRLKEINSVDESTKVSFNIDIYGEIYYVEYLVKHNVMYLTNITNHVKLQTLHDNKTEALGYINIDNFEEALKDFDVQTKAEYEGKIIGAIVKWASENGVFVVALTSTRYLMITDQQHLDKLIQDNFSILDEIKSLFHTSRIIRITLSMGIACVNSDIDNHGVLASSLSENALEQLDLALNRGGDQVVVKRNNELLYFGAKTDPIVKESKVEIRVMSEELSNLMINSSNIFVVGHNNIDADGFAATVAIYKWAKALGKEAYIINDLSSIDSTVEKLLNTIKSEYVSFLDAFISPADIGKKANKESLLMVVDFQTVYQSPDNKIFNHFEKIGIIDHHRKGEGAITNHKFYYSQPSASSSVELIFELMSFTDEPVELTELEATWMLLGIVVDTNNFTYRTSSSTFEVASILKKYGADMITVKNYLKEDVNAKLERHDIVKTMERYKDVVAIAYAEDDMELERASLAKASDELISVSGIELAVVVGRIGPDQIGLSARSLGKVNSQIIMEKMGGGGHLNNAAAQRKGETVKQTIEILKEKIDSYLLEEENMKIILLKDVKGKGKKDDVVEVAAGYGNNLVRNGSAVIASPENLKHLEDAKNEIALKEAAHLQEMKDLKEKLEKSEIKIGVKIGKEGKMFGSVSTKQIADAISAQLHLTVDKRKIELENTISSLGAYQIPIQLHKEVLAKIKLFVIEE